MLSLQRKRASTLDAKYHGAQKQAKELQLLKHIRDQRIAGNSKITFDASFWTEAKVQLKAESFMKCAYCESPTALVAHGDVEHYRPKSMYWWLAYSFDNYLFACQICNQVYKKDKFPIDGTKWEGPTIAATTSDTELDFLSKDLSPDPLDINNGFSYSNYELAHRKEKPKLINPYLEDPANIIAYQKDDQTEQVWITPLKPQYQSMVVELEKCYGINRLELTQARYEVLYTFLGLFEVWKELDPGKVKTETEKRFKRMLKDRSPYAGMLRYFVRNA